MPTVQTGADYERGTMENLQGCELRRLSTGMDGLERVIEAWLSFHWSERLGESTPIRPVRDQIREGPRRCDGGGRAMTPPDLNNSPVVLVALAVIAWAGLAVMTWRQR